MAILGGGFWVEVRFKDYSPRSTYMHIHFEFWLWGVFNMFNIYMYWERNPLRLLYKSNKIVQIVLCHGITVIQQPSASAIYLPIPEGILL